MSERVILEPGSPAPDFTLHDQNGQKVSLASLRGRRVIVFVYPAAMTPGCTTEACDFRDSLVPLQAAGYGVDQVTGTYREEIFGLHKPLGPDPANSPIGLKTEGRFQLNRISFIDTLNTL